MIMLKDNHIRSAGNITAAVAAAKRLGGFSVKVEVETSTLAEALEACRAGADVVMIDNQSPDALRDVATMVRADPVSRGVLLEASGGITLETLAAYMCPPIDVISLGSLTQGVQHCDFSLKIQ